jgi:arylsulfatase A-like enzyme
MPQNHPNLVFVFPDQFRQQAIGFMGADPVITPNLDRFAGQSVVLTNAVSNRPVCSPYRAMLFTGMYPHSNGVLTNCYSGTKRYDCQLRETDRCFSDVLHDLGYSQGYIGKFHLDLPDEAHAEYTEGRRGDGHIWDAYTPPGPRRHGFDFWHSYGCCDRHLNPHYWTTDAAIDERIEPEEWSVKHETDVAVRYIRNSGGECREPGAPFSLVVSFNPPHPPFDQVPRKYVEMYGEKTNEELLNRPNVSFERKARRALMHAKNYFAAVTGVDEQFGRILKALEDEGLADDTVVVFSADHGEMLGSHGRMGKVAWYDESLLMPFIVRWPGRIAPRSDDLLLGVPDVMPTLLGLAGFADHIPGDVEGTDYSRALLGEDMARPTSALYLNTTPRNAAAGARGLRTHRYTFVIERTKDGGERVHLYDNEADPYQMTDIAGREPEVEKRLAKELDEWLRRTNDPWLG